MTNEQIIFSNRIKLMNEGIIGNTGRNIVIEDDQGRKTLTKEPEEIHTYMEWKRRGYTVKHGEKHICRLTIWKSVPVRKEGEEPKEKMIMKEAFFFKASQVEKGEEKKAV